MKKDRINILLIILFIIGLSVMLYPIVSNYWNSRTQSKAVASYSSSVQDLGEDNKQEMLSQARMYNEKISRFSKPFIEADLLKDEYYSTLDISGTGIMGYIDIDSIGVELPIYHGTGDAILQVAVGHLEGSSLPVGGVGTHCVLSAHRGLPSAKLFTDLDRMVEGDTFKITVLDNVVTYRVDQIRIVLPYQTEDLEIDPQKDYCTLMTCTPYGVNSHRLLVRGVRTENAVEEHEYYVAAEAHQVNTNIVAIVIAIVILVFTALGAAGRSIWMEREKRKKEKDEKTD